MPAGCRVDTVLSAGASRQRLGETPGPAQPGQPGAAVWRPGPAPRLQLLGGAGADWRHGRGPDTARPAQSRRYSSPATAGVIRRLHSGHNVCRTDQLLYQRMMDI